MIFWKTEVKNRNLDVDSLPPPIKSCFDNILAFSQTAVSEDF